MTVRRGWGRLWTVAPVMTLMLAASVPASAQTKPPPPDPTRLEAARRLMEITGTSRQFDAMMPRLMAQVQSQIERRAPKNKKDIGEVMSGLGTKYAARKSELMDKVAGLYASKLTAAELEAVIRFFSDGAGQRYLKVIPELVEGSQAVGQEWGRAIGEEIRKDAEAELRKRKVPL